MNLSCCIINPIKYLWMNNEQDDEGVVMPPWCSLGDHFHSDLVSALHFKHGFKIRIWVCVTDNVCCQVWIRMVRMFLLGSLFEDKPIDKDHKESVGGLMSMEMEIIRCGLHSLKTRKYIYNKIFDEGCNYSKCVCMDTCKTTSSSSTFISCWRTMYSYTCVSFCTEIWPYFRLHVSLWVLHLKPGGVNSK